MCSFMYVRGGSAVLREVSRQILKDASVICFDEMQVGLCVAYSLIYMYIHECIYY